MTEALRDYDQQAGADPLEQADTDDQPTPKDGTREQRTAWPALGVGMPLAQAELLGDYNLYNG